ncbi:MAG: hypothetical protein CMN87_07225 [Stappia sp.]|uniref:DUF2164 domain-containing protein n=1 Tax=Stappia sp. TaxID=1870903 RepID=UPI000C6A3464|nr:DUF2164 family protein [Stappia sp.]MAB00368.1 hypothetical protein [Stappia sp.]MBM19783.1 hypothetical protein [Stappia sp.]
MANIELSTPERAALAEWLRERIAEETGEEIGGLEAESLAGALVRDIAGHFYNRGLHDARAAISARLEEVSEIVYAMEEANILTRR